MFGSGDEMESKEALVLAQLWVPLGHRYSFGASSAAPAVGTIVEQLSHRVSVALTREVWLQSSEAPPHLLCGGAAAL
ncbi:hypothetical protein EYF80_004387 [Liparis tanakae]|uniref:Uncharacterized protein n=1 Tax=Liparis tanakae TaxID=230148 RepID=A0A4Z2J4S9_9TELE|nr:hypothetical protein EYF80_004387 [Liparis tanakae]